MNRNAYRIRFLFLLLVGAVELASCAAGPTGPSQNDSPAPPGALRVLFLGNSLTYFNDLPGVIAAMADSLGGKPFWYRSAVAANYSLEDHWLTSASHDALARDSFDIVIMQQGPSSLPANQQHLREWSIRWAGPIRDAGAVPALYMVWPDASRRAAFEDVSDAYTAAAEAVDGMLFPVGRAWLEAWALDPGLALYGSDAFHPSGLGTYLAALVILDRLYSVDLDAVPARLRTRGGVTITVPETMHGALIQAAREANRKYGR